MPCQPASDGIGRVHEVYRGRHSLSDRVVQNFRGSQFKASTMT